MIAIRFLSSTLFVLLLSVQSAHAGGLAAKIKSWLLAPQVRTAPGTEQLVRTDSSTAQCMQCHNGSHGMQIDIKGAEAPMQFNRIGKQVNHPVGMDYETYASRKPGSYVHPAMLNPRVRLVEGQVSCVSCHQERKTQLAMAGGQIQSDAMNQFMDQPEPDQCRSSRWLTTGPNKNDLCAACHTV
ncbi:MAG: hypothetical protein OEZ10_00020 [Gammaproteobacteria bacterium]|nr:hypothetical protein [Gammaproteobacteria bacterium]